MINTVKLGFKQLSDKEQIGNSEPFSVTNLPVYLINSEQIGISEQFFDDQKVIYYVPSLTVKKLSASFWRNNIMDGNWGALRSRFIGR